MTALRRVTPRYDFGGPIELRVGARSRDGSHVDNEIDSGLLQQIGKFDDRPGRMAYGEKGIRHGSDGQAHDNRGRIAPIG
jgi:hypothetical protein